MEAETGDAGLVQADAVTLELFDPRGRVVPVEVGMIRDLVEFRYDGHRVGLIGRQTLNDWLVTGAVTLVMEGIRLRTLGSHGVGVVIDSTAVRAPRRECLLTEQAMTRLMAVI